MPWWASNKLLFWFEFSPVEIFPAPLPSSKSWSSNNSMVQKNQHFKILKFQKKKSKKSLSPPSILLPLIPPYLKPPFCRHSRPTPFTPHPCPSSFLCLLLSLFSKEPHLPFEPNHGFRLTPSLFTIAPSQPLTVLHITSAFLIKVLCFSTDVNIFYFHSW